MKYIHAYTNSIKYLHFCVTWRKGWRKSRVLIPKAITFPQHAELVCNDACECRPNHGSFHDSFWNSSWPQINIVRMPEIKHNVMNLLISLVLPTYFLKYVLEVIVGAGLQKNQSLQGSKFVSILGRTRWLHIVANKKWQTKYNSFRKS